MKSLIQKIIQKRNPKFKFDPALTNRFLFNLLTDKIVGLLRGVLLLPFHLKKPGLIFIGRNTRFANMHNVNIGKWTTIGDGVCLNGFGKKKLAIGKSVTIGAYSQIIISTSYNNLGEYITIGNNVGLGEFARLGGSGGLEIGDNCIIAQYFSCHPENHNFDSNDALIKDQGTTRAPIKIGPNCWIGAKVTILAGVEIGANCVVAAGAVVTKSVPQNSVVAGVPAKVIKTR